MIFDEDIDTINKLMLNDIKEFYGTNNATVAVMGDFEKAAKKAAEKLPAQLQPASSGGSGTKN